VSASPTLERWTLETLTSAAGGSVSVELSVVSSQSCDEQVTCLVPFPASIDAGSEMEHVG